MAQHNIPPSPNWYCSKVSDANCSGQYVFGARSNVFMFKTTSGAPKYVGIFTDHKDRVSTVLLGQTEETLMLCCSTSDDGTVKVWDTTSRQTIKFHSEHKDKISCGSWSSLQRDLIVTGDERGNLMCWQYETDICQKFKQEKEYVFSIACSPHKKFQVAVGYKSGTVLLLDITKNCKVLHKFRGHDDEIHSIAWCPVPGETVFDDEEKDDNTTGSILATGSRDRTIRFWSTEKGRQLFQKKLPVNTGFKREQREDGRNKVWLSLCWRKEKWHQLISSSHGGDLLLWDLQPSAEKPMQIFSASEGKCHTRVVFNICCGGVDNNILFTISMDRLVGVWNLKTVSCICAVPTLGGYMYTVKSSPVDPGRLAIGVGDSMIRVWNTNNKSNIFDVQTLWQGIKSKVTCLNWHPSKEGWLAYGTDDGRVGIYDIFSQKPPLLSGTFHRKTVYVVVWGPPSKCTEENKSNFSLYTVGDGIILEHHPKSLQQEATQINKLIETVNGKKTPGSQLIRSDISWKPDYSLVAIGNEDGSVDVYWADFKLRCVIQVHRKLINCLQWHPHITTQGGSAISSCNSWLASGANDAMVHIVDLSDIPVDKPVTIIESMRKLDGHSIRVTGLSWSPHIDGRIASCGYDSSVIVWNVKTGTALVKYDEHQGRILGVLWSGLDPDEVMSGGFDCSLHRWKISSLPKAVIEYGAKRKKSKKKRTDQDNKKRDHKTSTGSDSNEASGGDREGPPKHRENKEMSDNDNNTTTTSHTELDDLQKLLDKKREELLKNAEQTSDNKDTNKKSVTQSNDNKLQQILGSRFYHETKKDNKSNKRTEKTESVPSNTASAQKIKKRKAKSYFPVIAQAENRGKSQTHNDLIQLTKIVCGEKNKRESVSVEHNHLGLFTNRRAAFKCLKKEGEYHQKNDNMDYFLQMEIWKGNIRGALQIAREKDELSDWLVAMAPLGSYDMWLTACEDYARQLEEDGQYHKSATYLLSCHKVYDAIDLFKRHKLYKEAVSLARVRLSPLEPLFEDLYTDWSQQLMKDGQYEQAAKCYVAMKKIQDAAKVLIRRSDQSSLKTAAHMTLLANEKQQGMLYAQRVVNQCLSQYTWQDAYKFLNEHEATKIFVPFVSVHELLVKELQILAGESIGPISSDKFSVWVDIPPQNSVIPDFILDDSESDPVLPWKPYLMGKHSFPHHVLRCWYGNLNVAMDTNSLSNMYKTLIHHQSGRQGLLDTSQIILQVSGDLTLFLLALLLNETTAAINHLLQAVISLHEAGQLQLMQAVCQLVLPHGPKYLLKLQQEVTALHVVISMESHMNIEGASKVNTLKRLLSELKEDDNISSTGHRCRELDCLRAYYYLAVANYLQDKKNKSSDEAKIQDVPSSETDIKVEPDVCANTSTAEADSTSEQPPNKDVDKQSQPDDKPQTAPSPLDQSKSQNISSIAQTAVAGSSKSEPSALTMNKLLDMSKGLLWDIQAKRYALTETLGYIHKAISQCLLTDKTKEKSSQPQNVSSHTRPDILLCSKGDKSNDRDVSVQKELTAEDSREDGKEKEVTDSADDTLHYSDVEMMLANGKDSANKSRKVLWEDQPPLYICDKHETSTRGTSCLSNPTKYINVPDEWYSMPVDKKYFMSYVTMPVLREEQDFVTHELKRIPDSSHVPFPTTFDTAKMLLKLTQMCEAQDMKEVIEYREKLVKWALNFAVTSKQREELNTLLDSVTKESAV